MRAPAGTGGTSSARRSRRGREGEWCGRGAQTDGPARGGRVESAACIPSRPGGPPDVEAPAWSGTPARLSAQPSDTAATAAPPPGRHVLDLGPGPTVLLHV